jgi:glycosyltransferase involved in cell wall biosynthesis
MALRGFGVAHFHSPFVYGARRVSAFGLKTIVHIHSEENREGIAWAFTRPPDVIVTCARFLVDHVRQALPEHVRERMRIVAVSNAVDTTQFTSGDRHASKHHVGADPGCPLALVIGNLSPGKGQETAIKSIAQLKRRGVRVALWMAGEERDGSGNYEQHLKKLIAECEVGDRVRLLGFRRDCADLMRAADVLLLPSRKEGLPLSILEAQAAKVVVIAAPAGGIPEIVRDGQTGLLVAADDHEGYANSIERVLQIAPLRQSIVENARRMIERDHSWPVYCEKVASLYRDLQ